MAFSGTTAPRPDLERTAAEISRDLDRLAKPPWVAQEVAPQEARPPARPPSRRRATRPLTVAAIAISALAVLIAGFSLAAGLGQQESKSAVETVTQTVTQTVTETVVREAQKPRTSVPVVAEGNQPSHPRLRRYLRPDLKVAGAPAQRRREGPLTTRVERLAAYVAQHPRGGDSAIRHWLYQHAWVVVGAKWGWQGGAEALRALIAVDEQTEALWGVGRRSQAEARYALSQLNYMQAHPKTRSTDWLQSHPRLSRP